MIDARTIGTPEEGLLQGRSKTAMSEYLLNNGYIQVVLRSHEDLSGGEAGATPPA